MDTRFQVNVVAPFGCLVLLTCPTLHRPCNADKPDFQTIAHLYRAGATLVYESDYSDIQDGSVEQDWRCSSVHFSSSIPNVETARLIARLDSVDSVVVRRPISRGAFHELTRIPSLKTLHLDASELPSEDIALLRNAKNLRELQLQNAKLDEQGLRAIFDLRDLFELGIRGSKLPPKLDLNGIKPKKLRWLSFHGSKFGESIFSMILQLEKPEYISIRGSGLSQEKIEKLETKFKDAYIDS